MTSVSSPRARVHSLVFALLLVLGAGPVWPRGGVGINLAPIRDYAPEHALCDASKRMRGWYAAGVVVPETWLDDRGWPRHVPPGQQVRTPVFANGAFPDGDFELWWRGGADVSLVGDVEAQGTPGRRVEGWRRTDYRVLAVEAPEGPRAWVEVSFEEVGERLEDLHLWRTDCGSAQPLPSAGEGVRSPVRFAPAFLERWRGTRSVRFMEWLSTNDSQRTTVEDATRLDDPSWAHRGVPIEVVVDLANALDADPWINLPHLADDELIDAWGRAVGRRLQPHLRVYVEYSNELWNEQFEQAGWAKERGGARWPGLTPFEAQLRFASQRAAFTTGRFTAAFTEAGGEDSAARVVRVLGAQAANPWTAKVGLEAAPPGAFDALTIAPYLSLNVAKGSQPPLGVVRGWSDDEVFAQIESYLMPETERWIRGHAAVASRARLPLIAYEIGQHLVGVRDGLEDRQLQELFRGVNRDPRMRWVYQELDRRWRAAGGGLANYFRSMSTSSKWGHWGLIGPGDGSFSPKYTAWRRLIEDQRRQGAPIIVHERTDSCCRPLDSVVLVEGSTLDLRWKAPAVSGTAAPEPDLALHAIIVAQVDGAIEGAGLASAADGKSPVVLERLDGVSRVVRAMRPGRATIEWVATTAARIDRGVIEVSVRPR